MGGKFATSTTVSVEKTQSEIKDKLRKYGVLWFGIAEQPDKGTVQFEFNGLRLQMDIPLPDPAGPEFTVTDTGRARSEGAAWKEYEQAVKSRWRALLLTIRAKLEAVEVGISTVEKEFLAYVIMGNGQPLGEQLVPMLIEAAQAGRMPKQLGLPAPK